MVFIGGAVVSLIIDDSAADEIHPTTDIDMTINIANYAFLNQIDGAKPNLLVQPSH